MATSRGSSYVALFLLLVVLAQGAYVGIGFYLAPQVARISPSPARPGELVTLHGANFGRDPWDNAVLFGNRSARVNKATPAAIEVEVPPLEGLPPGTTRVPVRVVVGSRVSAPIEIPLAIPVAAAPSPEPTPEPTPEPAPEPAPSEAATATPPARPAPRPSATPVPGPRVADLVAEAAGAESARRFEEAVALYDRALAVEPGHAKALAGRETARAHAAALARTFRIGKTVVQGPPVGRADFREFDTREVAVRKEPEVPGRLEFEVAPSRLTTGDAFAVKVYLQNEGTKSIKISSLRVTTTTNGTPAPVVAAPRTGEAAARARVLVYETQGVWKEGVASWQMDVQVSSSRGDGYRNQAVWK